MTGLQRSMQERWQNWARQRRVVAASCRTLMASTTHGTDLLLLTLRCGVVDRGSVPYLSRMAAFGLRELCFAATSRSASGKIYRVAVRGGRPLLRVGGDVPGSGSD